MSDEIANPYVDGLRVDYWGNTTPRWVGCSMGKRPGVARWFLGPVPLVRPRTVARGLTTIAHFVPLEKAQFPSKRAELISIDEQLGLGGVVAALQGAAQGESRNLRELLVP